MEVREFENAILKKGLMPMEVIFRKGKQVKWFLCRGDDPFELILFNEKDQAWFIQMYEPINEETVYNICYHEKSGTIRVNGLPLGRCTENDLFNDSQGNNRKSTREC